MTVAKYSANGNDFVIFHTFVERDRSMLAQKLCHRQEGVGADGLIVLLPHKKLDFKWQFYNADGSEAAMCGNGSRVAAHYAHVMGLAGARMRFLTGAGEIAAQVEGDVVTSELTPPQILDERIDEEGERWWLIDTGVPHLVGVRDSVETFDLAQARRLRQKYDANVNIVASDGDRVRVRTYERGVEDETLACGTGMAASYYRLLKEGLLRGAKTVVPTSGESVRLDRVNDTLTLTGPVRRTFIAWIEINDITE